MDRQIEVEIDYLIHQDKYERHHEVEMFIPERALRLLGRSVKYDVPIEKLKTLVEFIDPNNCSKEKKEDLWRYVDNYPTLYEFNMNDDEFTINFFLNLPLINENDVLKWDASFLESYPCRPKFSNYGGIICFEKSNDKYCIKSIEYKGTILTDPNHDQWNNFKFILRSSAVSFMLIKNYNNEFLDNLIFITLNFTKESWEKLKVLPKSLDLANSSLCEVLQLNNDFNINISYLVNSKFAASRYYYKDKLYISSQSQQLLLFSKLYIDKLLK